MPFKRNFQAAVLEAFLVSAQPELSGADIWRLAGVTAKRRKGLLMQLQAMGVIMSRWVDTPGGDRVLMHRLTPTGWDDARFAVTLARLKRNLLKRLMGVL